MLLSCPICSPHKRSNCTPDRSSFSSTPVSVSNPSGCLFPLDHNPNYFTPSAVSNQPPVNNTTGFFTSSVAPISSSHPTPVAVSNPSCLSLNNPPSLLASNSYTPVAVSNPSRPVNNTTGFFYFNSSVAPSSADRRFTTIADSKPKLFLNKPSSTSVAVSNPSRPVNNTTGLFNFNSSVAPSSADRRFTSIADSKPKLFLNKPSSTSVAVSNPSRPVNNTTGFFNFNSSVAPSSADRRFTSIADSKPKLFLNKPSYSSTSVAVSNPSRPVNNTTGFFNFNSSAAPSSADYRFTPVAVSKPSSLSPNKPPSSTSHSSTQVTIYNPFPGCRSPHNSSYSSTPVTVSNPSRPVNNTTGFFNSNSSVAPSSTDSRRFTPIADSKPTLFLNKPSYSSTPVAVSNPSRPVNNTTGLFNSNSSVAPSSYCRCQTHTLSQQASVFSQL